MFLGRVAALAWLHRADLLPARFASAPADDPFGRCFATRFGVDATRFVNSREGLHLHLRGIYARIVEAGTVTVGDAVAKA